MKNKDYDKKYFEDHDWFNLLIAESIKMFMHDHHLKKVLDVGCGTGRLIQFLNENDFSAVGCDNSAIAVKIAQKNNKKNAITKASATHLPFPNASFDLITGISMIEHLSKSETTDFLKEAHRVLQPSGFVFIITPNYASPLRLIHKEKWFGYSDPTHITFFTPGSLSHLLIQNGFKNAKIWFKTSYSEKFDSALPSFFSKLPTPVKKLGIHLLFSTPLTLIRDSFWIAARKTTI